VKWVGAAYLVWIGVRTWRSGDAPDERTSVPSGQTVAQIFREGFLVEVLNPKTALFFLAFVPQFVDPARGAVWVQFLALGITFVALSVAFCALLVTVASSARALFEGAPMATALLATMPHVAAYTAVRLLVGHADGVPHELEMLSVLALATSVWGAALALVQRDLRGFVGHLAMTPRRFLATVTTGIAARLTVLWFGGKQVEDQIQSVVGWINRYQWWVVGALFGVTIFQSARRRSPISATEPTHTHEHNDNQE
ncbi:MAG: hypothetical protein EBS32_09885, partial [Actinobacteria bacterium]|nr:hypothetical protein [Actinomycetota bacterium]